MMSETNGLAQYVRIGLRDIGCYFIYMHYETAVSVDVAFRLKRSPDGCMVFVEIPRDWLPSNYGYSQFQRNRQALRKSLGSPIELHWRNGAVMIKFSMHENIGKHPKRQIADQEAAFSNPT